MIEARHPHSPTTQSPTTQSPTTQSPATQAPSKPEARGSTVLANRKSPREQLALLNALTLERDFAESLSPSGLRPFRSVGLEILQVNVGKLCNQTCHHCHVDAGPTRTENMDRKTMETLLGILDRTDIATVDLTGGAPEMNPHFRWFVTECRARGKRVIDRCNLTILTTPLGRDLPQFFAEHEVEVVCSLPHFRKLSTDRQRGDGVFDRSIEALRALNEVGYGDPNGRLSLTLVTNPVGAFLPGNQASLEMEWKREMQSRWGVRFNNLFTITNMPISRFLEFLEGSGNLEAYMRRLVDAYNPEAARHVMCRNTLSVGWDGQLYDCDFNQMLELPVSPNRHRHVRDFDPDALNERDIIVGRHCFGCTAGAGSSCGGATT